MRSMRDIFRSYAVLDTDGRHVGGTDKESNHHYGDTYESLFTTCHPNRKDVEPWSVRASVKMMMEVGVADGSSLLAWRDIFPNALCVGMDIHPAHRLVMKPMDRIEFHLGDEREKSDCDRVAAGRKFDLIVEDATHQLRDTLVAILHLWPFVRPGGLYVVEEFANIGALRDNIAALWPFADIVDTRGPSGGVEPLVVFRKPI